MISFTLRDDIYIIIEKESDIETNDFHEEILGTGKVIFYKKDNTITIECKNREIENPNKYNCLLLSGK